MGDVIVKDRRFVSTTFRSPVVQDAPAIRKIVQESGVLDLNSLYSYLLLCQHFAETCMIVEAGGQVLGFTTGYRLPADRKVLFIWQIGVAKAMRGRGLGLAMLKELLGQNSRSGVTFIEATVTPSNQPSRALFRSLARELEAEYNEKPHFDSALFGADSHEQENLVRIGPLRQTHSQGGEI